KTAFKVLQYYPNIKFVIAGDFNTVIASNLNRNERKVLRYIERRPLLKNSIVFTGILEDVSALLASSYILVWPAVVPHFARPVMEGMVMGIPVIASDFESSSEIIEDGKNGFLEKPYSRRFANRILYLLKEPEKAKLIGEAARIKALGLFNAEENNRKIGLIIQ